MISSLFSTTHGGFPSLIKPWLTQVPSPLPHGSSGQLQHLHWCFLLGFSIFASFLVPENFILLIITLWMQWLKCNVLLKNCACLEEEHLQAGWEAPYCQKKKYSLVYQSYYPYWSPFVNTPTFQEKFHMKPPVRNSIWEKDPIQDLSHVLKILLVNGDSHSSRFWL